MVQAAKQRAIPGLYFTNLMSARPLMGVAGAGSLAAVVNAAMGSKARFDQMRGFFEGVGSADSAGIWEQVPQAHPQFRDMHRRQMEKQARRRKAEEMI